MESGRTLLQLECSGKVSKDMKGKYYKGANQVTIIKIVFQEEERINSV